MPKIKTEEKESVEIPSKFREIVEKIESMSVLDLSELVGILEKKFGVSSQPAVMFGDVSVSAAGEAEAKSEEKSAFNVELKEAGGQKIQVIKAIKDILGLGLKEAKDFVDAAPKLVKQGIAKNEAEEIKKKLEEAGAAVEIK